MFIGWIEIPKSATRYLDMPEEKKRELTKKRRRRCRRKKVDSEAEDKEGVGNKTPNHQNLHSRVKKNKKDPIEISFNGAAALHNWDYEANNYKTN
ncbi:hypothetical protein [Bacillus cereus]|uniref:Uncharacterized protein n=1 Tax=Bacillus cereus MC67 TaxID=1053219 RepID=J8FEU4_BACCE|nr:hypothetical protein [Bacillus cereus]EJQ99160.1 hypothetical protein II3_03140 [Bacillus cereus MC67]EOP17238.1 hypothetical protein II1_01709 [Bacillus cereus MC118]